MQLGELRRDLRARLTSAGRSDADASSRLLCVQLLNLKSPTDIYLHDRRPVDARQAQTLRQNADRLLDGTPLAYILGSWDFLGDPYQVGPGVLIPRADSEPLIIAALERIGPHPPQRILDLCTGSGALGIGLCRQLAQPPQSLILADTSAGALAYAQHNRQILLPHVAGGQIQMDMCAALAPGSRFDLILCNPPYLSTSELTDPELAAEPRLALDGGPDGLDFYRRLQRDVRPHLAPGGLLVFEAGWQQEPALRRLMGDFEPLRDLAGRFRGGLLCCD